MLQVCREFDESIDEAVKTAGEDYNNKVTKEGSVLIEENAWIGAGSIVLPNSTLGKRSILGAGSTLTKKTKDNEIWYGVPATFKRKLC